MGAYTFVEIKNVVPYTLTVTAQQRQPTNNSVL